MNRDIVAIQKDGDYVVKSDIVRSDSKTDRMAAKNKQKYYFVFVREDGVGLKRISEMFGNRKIETSVDKIYDLSEINEALAKVAGGGSKGKTVIKIS